MGTLLVTTYRSFMDPDKFRNGCDNILSEAWKGQLWFVVCGTTTSLFLAEM
jgi:hypothetical protein